MLKLKRKRESYLGFRIRYTITAEKAMMTASKIMAT